MDSASNENGDCVILIVLARVKATAQLIDHDQSLVPLNEWKHKFSIALSSCVITSIGILGFDRLADVFVTVSHLPKVP